MKLSVSEENERFRTHVRTRIAELLPPDLKHKHCTLLTNTDDAEEQRRWIAILAKEGWSTPHWPVDYGGPDWSPLKRFIFEDEIVAADAPEFNVVTMQLVGPVIYTFGSDEQKLRFLPPIRSGQHIWAQGFSEPGAGSDLASLRTHARLEGDRYIVNGQKIWTSGAFSADWGFFLVKTSLTEKAQQSITFLLIDLKSPGITVRRIPQINGEAHLCEVFLDNVEVPENQRVGDAGKGWTYAKFLLDHERIASSFIFWTKRELRRCKELARVLIADDRPLIETSEWASRIARIESQVLVHEWSVLRVLAGEQSDFGITAAAAVLKLRGSDLQHALTELQVDMLGAAAARDYVLGPAAPDEGWPEIIAGRTSRALIARAATIYGGTRQIQKNVLARVALGL